MSLLFGLCLWLLFLCLIMASLTFIATTMVLVLTNANKQTPKAIKSLEARQYCSFTCTKEINEHIWIIKHPWSRLSKILWCPEIGVLSIKSAALTTWLSQNIYSNNKIKGENLHFNHVQYELQIRNCKVQSQIKKMSLSRDLLNILYFDDSLAATILWWGKQSIGIACSTMATCPYQC